MIAVLLLLLCWADVAHSATVAEPDVFMAIGNNPGGCYIGGSADTETWSCRQGSGASYIPTDASYCRFEQAWYVVAVRKVANLKRASSAQSVIVRFDDTQSQSTSAFYDGDFRRVVCSGPNAASERLFITSAQTVTSNETLRVLKYNSGAYTVASSNSMLVDPSFIRSDGDLRLLVGGNSSGRVLRSADGGASWSLSAVTGFTSTYDAALVSEVIAVAGAAAVGSSVVTSADFGDSWSPSSFSSPIDIYALAARTIPDRMLLGVGFGPNGQVARSIDQGRNFLVLGVVLTPGDPVTVLEHSAFLNVFMALRTGGQNPLQLSQNGSSWSGQDVGTGQTADRIAVARRRRQNIFWGDAASEVPFGSPFEMGSTFPTAESGLSVLVTVEPPSVCSYNPEISPLTVVTHGTGACHVRALQPGNAFWKPEKLTRTFNVTRANQTISWSGPPPEDVYVGKIYVSPAVASSGLPVVNIVSPPSVCRIGNLYNRVVMVGPGLCTLVAAQPGNANFNSAHPLQFVKLVQVQPEVNAAVTAETCPSGVVGSNCSCSTLVCTELAKDVVLDGSIDMQDGVHFIFAGNVSSTAEWNVQINFNRAAIRTMGRFILGGRARLRIPRLSSARSTQQAEVIEAEGGVQGQFDSVDAVSEDPCTRVASAEAQYSTTTVSVVVTLEDNGTCAATLSTGAIVGIAVGAAVLVAVVVVAIVGVFWHRRKSREAVSFVRGKLSVPSEQQV